MPNSEKIRSSGKPKRDERETHCDARKGQTHGVRFRHGRNEPFTCPNQNECRHDEHDSDKQYLDGSRHGLDRPVAYFFGGGGGGGLGLRVGSGGGVGRSVDVLSLRAPPSASLVWLRFPPP